VKPALKRTTPSVKTETMDQPYLSGEEERAELPQPPRASSGGDEATSPDKQIETTNETTSPDK
jgi:hypothetical protein